MQVDNLIVIAEKIEDTNVIEVERIIKQKYIYHYTSREGLKGILDSGKLWFSKIDCLNDKDEIFDGINLLIENALRNIDSEESDASIKKMQDSMCERLFQNQIFVCSFSKKADEIALWSNYTKDSKSQGYNLAFTYDELLSSIIVKNKDILDECSVSFGQVEYANNNKKKSTENMWNEFVREHYKKVEEIFFNIISELFIQKNINIAEDEIVNCIQKNLNETIQKKKGKLPSIVTFEGENLKFKKSIYSENIVYCKNKTWLYEYEARIVIMIPNDKIEHLKSLGVYKQRYKDGIEIPYLELGYDRQCIQGIMTSPYMDLDLEKSWIEGLCYSNKVDVNKMQEGVKASEIHVRY